MIKRCLILIYVAILLTSCRGAKLAETTRTGSYMGTTWKIVVVDIDRRKAEKAIGLAYKEVERIDKMMSKRNPDSEVSLINKAAWEKAVPVSKDTAYVIQSSKKISELSSGAFDITVGPLFKLMRFDDAKPIVPPQKEVDKILPLVNYKGVTVSQDKDGAFTVKLAKKGMEIDLGGIAKGFAVDKAVNVLKENGIKNAFVEGGGNSKFIGFNLKKEAWKVGVQHPRKKDEIVKVLEVKDKALSTSGDYERYFEKDGVRYSHILDPKTGFSARHCLSVTVMVDDEKDCTAGDGLSTALFVLGPKKGLELVKRLQGIEAIFLEETSSGIKIHSSFEKK